MPRFGGFAQITVTVSVTTKRPVPPWLMTMIEDGFVRMAFLAEQLAFGELGLKPRNRHSRHPFADVEGLLFWIDVVEFQAVR